MGESIEEIEGILRDAGLSVIYDDTNHPAGWMAVAFPLGHESGVLIGQPTGVGESQLAAAQWLLMDWRSRSLAG